MRKPHFMGLKNSLPVFSILRPRGPSQVTLDCIMSTLEINNHRSVKIGLFLFKTCIHSYINHIYDFKIFPGGGMLVVLFFV